MLGTMLVNGSDFLIARCIKNAGLHLLRGCCDISRCFDNALATIVVLVEFCAEAFEHGHEWRLVCCAVLGIHGGVRSFNAHCCAEDCCGNDV